jgi:predicted small lipoprotein YifL
MAARCRYRHHCREASGVVKRATPMRQTSAPRPRPGNRIAPLLATVLIAVVLTAGTLAACGQKGPLYLPSQKKSKVPATQPPQTTPAPGSPAGTPYSTPSGAPPDLPPSATPPPQSTTAAPS